MRAITHALGRLARDRKAATAVEYGLIIAFIVIAMVSALSSLGQATTGFWENVSSKVETATG
ncbi:Flp family type IVb pilin [Sphingomonas sp.]|uniref:Flp family type IVb pilin n=1 Tax=Sphingomonas sp. TaxID=28214 RepID=UPI002D80032D|nr:Flp family type IVb pilin [Sphingomonas sp.]